MKVEINVGDRWEHVNGHVYEIVCIANEHSTNPNYPITVVYKSEQSGRLWCTELSNFLIRMLGHAKKLKGGK